MIGLAMQLDENILLCSFYQKRCGYVSQELHWYLGQRPERPTENNVMVVTLLWS